MATGRAIYFICASYGSEAIQQAKAIRETEESHYCFVDGGSPQLTSYLKSVVDNALRKSLHADLAGAIEQKNKGRVNPSFAVLGRRLAPLAHFLRSHGFLVETAYGSDHEEEPSLRSQLAAVGFRLGRASDEQDPAPVASLSLPRLLAERVEADVACRMRIDDLSATRLAQRTLEKRDGRAALVSELLADIGDEQADTVREEVEAALEPARTALKSARYRHFATGRSPNTPVRGPSLHLWLLDDRVEADLLEHAFHEQLMTTREPRIEEEAGLFLLAEYQNNHRGLVVADEEAQEAIIMKVFLTAPGSYANIIQQTIADSSAANLRASVDHRHGWIRATIESLDPSARHVLDEFADRLLNNLLVGNRPVARWRTNFLVAMADHDDKWRTEFIWFVSRRLNDGSLGLCMPLSRTSSTSSEADFLLPELRQLLVRNVKDASEAMDVLRRGRERISFEWRSVGKDGIVLKIDDGRYPNGGFEGELSGLRIHFSESDSFLVEWEISGPSEEEFRKAASERLGLDIERETTGSRSWDRPEDPLLQKSHSTLWRHYLSRPANTHSFAFMLDTNAEARFSHYSYRRVEEDVDGTSHETSLSLRRNGDEKASTRYLASDVPPGRRPEEKSFVQAFLEVLLGKCHAKIELLTDDRARVVTSLILEGERPTCAGDENFGLDAFDGLLARLNMVDAYGVGHPYGAAFSLNELKKSSYDRFAERGSYLHATEHSFSHLSFRHHPGIHDGKAFPRTKRNPVPPAASFGEAVVHGEHMRGIYRRLFMHFLFMEAELRRISIKLTELSVRLDLDHGDLSGDDLANIHSLRRNLIRVSNLLRQHNLSTQVQGHELTELLAARFRLDAEWDLLDRKIQLLEEVQRGAADRHNAAAVNALTVLGLPAAVMAFFFALQPEQDQTAPANGPWSIAKQISDWITWLWPSARSPDGVAVAFIALVVGALAVLFGHWLASRVARSPWKTIMRSAAWPVASLAGICVLAAMAFAFI